MDLTDKQWSIIEPLFAPKRRAHGRGRRWREPRDVLNSVLWVLRTGAPGRIRRCHPQILRPEASSARSSRQRLPLIFVMQSAQDRCGDRAVNRTGIV
jgi:hypothetical protein